MELQEIAASGGTELEQQPAKSEVLEQPAVPMQASSGEAAVTSDLSSLAAAAETHAAVGTVSAAEEQQQQPQLSMAAAVPAAAAASVVSDAGTISNLSNIRILNADGTLSALPQGYGGEQQQQQQVRIISADEVNN